jgi:predicted PurR-regulated permease PerM
MPLPNDPLRTPALEHKTLLWLVVAFTVAFVFVMWPLTGAVLWALFLAIVFWPMHGRCKALIRRPSLAALATLLSIVLIVIVPLALVSASVVNEASAFYQKVKSGEIVPTEWLQRALEALPGWARSILERFGLTDVQAMGARIGGLLASSSQTITNSLLGFGQITLDFVVSFFIMLYLLFFLLRDGGELSAHVARAVPLRREQTRELLGQFVTVVRATVKGNVVVAIVQGGLGGIAFWYLGLPGATLWGALMALLSLLPAVGAAIVWAPVALWKLFAGEIGAAIGLTVWGVLVIGLVDNVLRPILVGRSTKLPDWLVLVATVGGIGLFGLNGFVIGPVIAAMFLVAWNLLTQVRERTPEVDAAPLDDEPALPGTASAEAPRGRRARHRSGSGPERKPPGPPRT